MYRGSGLSRETKKQWRGISLPAHQLKLYKELTSRALLLPRRSARHNHWTQPERVQPLSSHTSLGQYTLSFSQKTTQPQAISHVRALQLNHSNENTANGTKHKGRHSRRSLCKTQLPNSGYHRVPILPSVVWIWKWENWGVGSVRGGYSEWGQRCVPFLASLPAALSRTPCNLQFFRQ